jgi:hypothetical protein
MLPKVHLTGRETKTSKNKTKNKTDVQLRSHHSRFSNIRQSLVLFAAVLILCAFTGILLRRDEALAATASTMNFQARLMNGSGSIAPDGNYNIEFKLYDTASTGGTAQGVCTGNCKWMETRTGGNVVTVANGYVTVNLGSVTAFGAGINWDQELWLTMNVGGTGSPSWDGEMSPRLKLTAVPYAFRAGQLAKLTGANTSTLSFDTQTDARNILLPDEDGVLCIQNSTDCGFVSGGVGDFIQNQNASSQTANFRINGTGRADTALQSPLVDTPTAVALDVGTTNATQINLNENTFVAADKNFSLQNGAGVFSQTFASSSAASAQTLSATNTNSGGSSVAVNGYNVTLVGTATSGGVNTNTALRFANPSAAANNVFYGLNFDGTGYTDILRVGSNQIINGSGVIQSVGVSGSYTGITGVGTLTAGALGAGFTTVSVAQGGTGAISFTSNGILYGNSTGALQVTAAGTTGQCLLGNTSAAPTWGACVTGSGAAFVQDGNDFNATAVLGTNDADNLQLETNNVIRATFDTSNSLYLGNGVTAAAPNNFAIRGTGSSTTAVTGGALTIQGGNATVGSASGGNVTITGGAGVGTGVRGLVVIDTPTFTTSSTQNCSINCSITQANIDGSGAVLINATNPSLTVTLSDPTITTAGRIMYVTNVGSNDFTLSVNGGGTGNTIAMKPNTTATMIWNGNDWTAAGASSSTDLQSAYNNTLTSAGGAELVLNASGGSADGLTIRNNATTPITGGILEVQSSIGTNLFSVNNLGTELAANGGSETQGTWSTNWTTVGSATVARTTTSGEYVTGLAGAEVTTTAVANDGIRNNLSANPVVSTTYQVSFAAKLASGTFSTLQVVYSRDGGTDTEACANYSTQTLSTSVWTKITCTITTDSTTATNPDLIIRQTDATVRNFWIDNLSFMRNDSTTQPSNVQIGGGINGGPITLFTLDRSTAPPVAAGDTTYLGSMYYDTTTGRIQCYESDGWGACGSAPDNIVTLTPEYTGAVLNGSGIGTMTADFCANDSALQVNTSFCASGLSRQYYKWTSPQATQQTYSIYVSYKLPNTFKTFTSANTMTLTALTDSTSNGTVDYEVFRSTGSAVTSCGSQTTVTTPSANTWYTIPFAGDETACGFVGGNYIVFKINVRAQSNANVYVENLDFIYLNQ